MLGNLALSIALFITGVAVALLSHPLRARAFRTRWEREPLFQAEQTISFDEQGVYFKMGQIESNLPWTYYENWLESADGFLLVYGDTFNYFPKRTFTEVSAIEAFRQLIKTKIVRRK